MGDPDVLARHERWYVGMGFQNRRYTSGINCFPSRLNHPDLHVTSDKDDQEGRSYKYHALDIIQTLKCHKLLNNQNQKRIIELS
jgi:hypothetical protein